MTSRGKLLSRIINNFEVSTFLSLDQPVKVARKIIIFAPAVPLGIQTVVSFKLYLFEKIKLLFMKLLKTILDSKSIHSDIGE